MWKDDTLPDDVAQVLKTSAILSIGEFEGFRLAYTAWFGRDGDEKTIEGHFLPYMFQETVPHWVRSFTRRVLELERRGRLDPDKLGVELPPPGDRDLALGSLYTFAVVLSVTALIIMIRLGWLY